MNENNFRDNKKIIWCLRGIGELGLVVVLSWLILRFCLYSSSNPLNEALYKSFFSDFRVVLMNLFPILCLMYIFYFLSGRLTIAFALTALPFGILAYANYFKLLYRDYPVVFSDMLLLGETRIMAGKYDITPMKFHIEALIAAIFLLVVLHFIQRGKGGKTERKIRMLLAAVTLLILGFGINRYMLTDGIYNMAGDETVLNNKWIESQQLQRRGVVFSFVHSVNSVKQTRPEGYDESEEKAIMSQYRGEDIAEEQKVNIVSIMLESFNDFTKFDLPLKEDIYTEFHLFEEEGMHGELISNVFGGGTVNTERNFLTGIADQPNYIKPVNSYVRYLNEQGYKTVAMHPCFGSFYNRRNINELIGFDEFYYVENRYGEIIGDDLFFEDIIKEFERSTSDGKPYFNFSLNYQGHGPYSQDNKVNARYLEMEQVEEPVLNEINNYFDGISNTNKNIGKLYEYFSASEKPVVLVMFGDHNPVFGGGVNGFEMMGINMDLSTQEGFQNYYGVPYVIWANDAAKKVLDVKTGEGETISPNYLMNKVFDTMGVKEPGFMQYSDEVLAKLPVIHSVWKKNEEGYLQNLSENENNILKEFQKAEYYYQENVTK